MEYHLCHIFVEGTAIKGQHAGSGEIPLLGSGKIPLLGSGKIPLLGSGEIPLLEAYPIYLDNVNCTGTEISLNNCKHNGIGIHNCGHNQDAGVNCSSENFLCRQ